MEEANFQQGNVSGLVDMVENLLCVCVCAAASTTPLHHERSGHEQGSSLDFKALALKQ